jgi:O-antigen/teichoic acid export membrane protein
VTTPNDSGGYSVRRVGKQTLIYGLGMLAVRLISLASLPVYFYLLNETDYGVVALVEVTFEVLGLIAGARLATGIFRFYHKAETQRGRFEVLSTAFLLLATLYVCVGVGAFLGADILGALVSGGAGEYGPIMRAAAIAFVFQGALLAPMSFLRLRDKASYYVLAEVGKRVIQFALNVVFLAWLDTGVIGVFYSNVAASAIVAPLLAGYLIRHTGARFSWSAARDFFRFGAPMMVNQAATLFVTFADRIVILRVTDAAQVGIYNVAFQFGLMAFAIGATPYLKIWDPLRHELALQKDKDAQLSRGFRHMNVLLITAGVGIVLFSGDVLRIASPADTEFATAAYLIPFLVGAHILLAWSSAQDIGILVRERTQFIAAANWIAALVSLAGFVTLIRWYGALGAALTCLLSYATRYLLIYWFSQRNWRVEYEWSPVLRLLLVAIVISGVGLLLPSMPSVLSIATRLGLLCCYFLLAWRTGILDEDERKSALRFARHPASALMSLRSN